MFPDIRPKIENQPISCCKRVISIMLWHRANLFFHWLRLIISHHVADMISWMTWRPVSPVDAPVRHRQKTVVTDMCYPAQISSLMDFGTPDCSLGKGTERLSEICSVAVETVGGVCGDPHWWLKESELQAWPWAWHGGPCRSRVWEQSVNSSQILI